MEEIPTAARESIRFEFLKTVDDALSLALEPEVSDDSPSSETRAAGSVS
jgi:hypothetical protein